MSYDLLLAEEKTKRHQVTALHLTCAMAFTGTGGVIYKYSQAITAWGLGLLIAGMLLLVITMAKNKWVTSPASNIYVRMAEAAIAATVAIYSAIQGWYLPLGIFGILAGAVLFAIYWERAADKLQYIHVDENGIKLPVTSRRRFIAWSEVEQVLLRHGTLSVDCADNRRFQFTMKNTATDKETFEAYCSKQIGANKEKKKEDW